MLVELKKFLREDGTFNDSSIETLLLSAQAELLLSGVPEYEDTEKEYPLYKICIFLIVSRDYDKRILEPSEQQSLDKNILRIRRFSVSEKEVNPDETIA